MIFAFSPEQNELRATVRRFLNDTSPVSEARRLMATEPGFDAGVWRRMAEQLGLQGLTVPEEHGGAGCGPVEQAIVGEEMGHVVFSGPFLASAVLAAPALRLCDDPVAASAYLPGIADGTTIATLAVAEDDGAWSTRAMATRARRDGSSYVLDGHKSFVLDGHLADLLLVAADTADGPSLFAVRGDAPGLRRRSLETIDRTRRQAALDLDAVPAELVGAAGAAEQVVERTVRLALPTLAAEQVGGAQRCLDMSVEYAKTRMQFGRPIGSFQAVKHACADMLLDVESARSAAYYAAWAAADGADDAALSAYLAKTLCSDVYVRTAAQNIQLHGGIGFTWEHDAHLYFRRATSTEMLLGTPEDLRERAATYLVDEPG